MTLLNQILAILGGAQSQADRDETVAYHTIQKAEPFTGLSRVYTPRDEDGETLPPEHKQVQTTVDRLLAQIAPSQARLLSLTLTRDAANQEAKADVVVGDRTVLTDVPVTSLIALEKWLVNFRTFVSKLPVLAADTAWTYDPHRGVYVSETIQTARTKKVPRAFTKAPATDKHPAQVEVFHEDIQVGLWAATRFSGAIPADRQIEMLDRIDRLADAVKMAREKANSMTVTDRSDGAEVLAYLLG